MADKIIKLRIDVTKINKEYLYKGEKGTYLDATLYYNEKQDSYGANGMITQDLPKSVYEAQKDKPDNEKVRGAILGNAKVFGSEKRESIPGSDQQATKGDAKKDEEVADDLPF